MSGGYFQSPASPCSAPLRSRLPACPVPAGPRAPPPAGHPGAHAGDASGRLALAGAAAPDPCARGRRTQSYAGQGPVPPHHRRTREGHQRRAPGSRPRPLTDGTLPPATSCSLLTPGTDTADRTVGGQTAWGTPPQATPAAGETSEVLRRQHKVPRSSCRAPRTPVAQGMRHRGRPPGTGAQRPARVRGSGAPHPRQPCHGARWRHATTDTSLA